ncbi:hypothetical protein SVIOM74S_04303 [Streptomyces violarus]
MDAAFTPPISGISSAERAAAIRGARRGFVSGSSTHGSSAPGRAAADVEPTTMVYVGHSAYTSAPSSRVAGEPTRSRSASRSAPRRRPPRSATARAAPRARSAPAADRPGRSTGASARGSRCTGRRSRRTRTCCATARPGRRGTAQGSTTTPSLVSNVMRPGDTARNATKTVAQNPRSQRRERGAAGSSTGLPGGGSPPSGDWWGARWTALVMNTARRMRRRFQVANSRSPGTRVTSSGRTGQYRDRADTRSTSVRPRTWRSVGPTPILKRFSPRRCLAGWARAPLVTGAGALGARVVPGGPLVAAPRRVPVGERDVDQPAGAGDARHLAEKGVRIRDVLQHVGGEGDIGHPVRQGQQIAVGDDRVPRPLRLPVTQLPGVRLEEIALRAAPPELPGEVAVAAADVDDDLPV